MAQQKMFLGHVKGSDGKDASIASATATVDATHSDAPTCTVDVGGEAGAQTLAFNFTGLQGAAGSDGSSGKDAAIASATATVDATHSESPTCTVDVGGEAGAQTLAFTFTGLQGSQGAAGTYPKPTVATCTLTAAGGTSQTVTATGVLADESAQEIHIMPKASDMAAYVAAGAYCSGQAENQLTFTCATAPTADLTVYVSMWALK